jgi:hypothetical protein
MPQPGRASRRSSRRRTSAGGSLEPLRFPALDESADESEKHSPGDDRHHEADQGEAEPIKIRHRCPLVSRRLAGRLPCDEMEGLHRHAE